MGCMNGRCSDSTTDVDGDQLISQPHLSGSVNSSEYSVRHLPPSPHPTDGMKSLGDQGFEQSAGGTMRWELHQDHMITSTQSEPSSRNGSGELAGCIGCLDWVQLVLIVSNICHLSDS